METTNANKETAADEVSDLLTSWNLPQLCKKFREEEVCINALRVLTEANIRELIPKVGPRAIFLFEWQRWRSEAALPQRQPRSPHTERSHVSSEHEPCTSNTVVHTLPLMPLVCKVESLAHVEQPDEITVTPEILNRNTDKDDLDDSLMVEQTQENSSFYDAEPTDSNSLMPSGLDPNVLEIIQSTPDGRKVLDFYAKCSYLDTAHRRRLIELVIGVVLQRRLRATHNLFVSLSGQINTIFPNEPKEVYYVPRSGNTCPRGALYNKHLNMGRAYRKDGVLQRRSRWGKPTLLGDSNHTFS